VDGAGKSHEAKVVLEEKGPSHVPSFVLGGVGLASAITGAVLTGVAQSNGADLQTNAPRGSDGQLLCRKTPTPASAATPACDAWRTKAAEAATMGNVGIGMFAVAGVAVAGAAAWWLVPSRSKPVNGGMQVIPVAGAEGAGVLVRGRF
jgi:hypothetical protein